MKKKKKSFSVKPVFLFAVAGLLILGSTVGSTRAALTYYSENYAVQAEVSKIGVSLLENGEIISKRDYDKDNQWMEEHGELLKNLVGKDEKFALGKAYDEALTVQNSGSIETFVRVILTKSWTDADGNKNTRLSPDLIDLNLLTDNGWVIDESATTRERTVLYYTRLLPAGERTPAISDTLTVDPSIGTKVKEQVVSEEEGKKTIKTIYEYDGYHFTIDAEADAVQTHNAQDAIKSAWGIDVTVSEDGNSISLQ